MTAKAGLKLSSESIPITVRPLTQDDEVSWIPHITPGDDQGDVGACVFFTLAEWAGIVSGAVISDREKIRVYQDEYLAGAPDEGADFPSAFACAQRVGWFDPNQHLRACDDLSAMQEQPLMVGVEVTDAFNVNAAGCFDHIVGNGNVLGYHAMLAIAIGRITVLGDARWVYLKNWWADSWGYRGMGIAREDLFQEICMEMWHVV